MTTHRRRKRGMVSRDEKRLKVHDELLVEQAARRIARRAWWDENRPNGEGESEGGVLYQWVRVTDSRQKVLGTFYLQQEEEKLVSLFLTTPRKGLAPNPYDESALSNAGWSAEQFEQAQNGVNQMREAIRRHPDGVDGVVENLERELFNNGATDNSAVQALLASYRNDLEAAQQGDSRVSRSGQVERSLREEHKNREQRPTKIVPIAATDRDTRFKFLDGENGFSVRGSKLGPILIGYRRAGIQHVTLEDIRRALRRLA